LTDTSLPDEVLFGRSGYLLALLFVRRHLGTEAVPQTVIRQVSIAARQCTVFILLSKLTEEEEEEEYFVWCYPLWVL